MVTAFSLNGNASESRSPYLTPGAMAQDAQENLQVPWSTVVLPTIWKNTENLTDFYNNSNKIQDMTTQARERGEKRLSLDELHALYPGVNFTIPTYADTAKRMAERQERMQSVNWIKEHSTVKGWGTEFIPEIGSYIARSFTDPIELGIMAATWGAGAALGVAFPKVATMTGSGLAYKLAGVAIPKNYLAAGVIHARAAELPLAARMGSSAITGFAENALAAVAMEPWIANASRQMGDDYTAANSVTNVLLGGLTGATFHTIGGLAGDAFTRMKSTEKLKALADYTALRMNGEDGVLAAAQNAIPHTTLAARDVLNIKNIKVEATKDGQYRARFTNEKGLLSQHEGVIGRTKTDAIRNLQETYITTMQDPLLKIQYDNQYGDKKSANIADLNPFKGEGKTLHLKNAGSITKGGVRRKLNFSSYVDKMFYNIAKIMNHPKNRGRALNDLAIHQETMNGYLEWIGTNLGNTTEAEVRKHARGVYNEVYQNAIKLLNEHSEAKEIKIEPFIQMSEFDEHPVFMSAETWAEKLRQQKEILSGTDKDAAFNLLAEIYNADKEVQLARKERLVNQRANIQKLINTTDEQLRTFTKRELTRKQIVDSILKTNKNITEEQLADVLFMWDVVTGDFSAWFGEKVQVVNTKEYQAKTESRLNQMIETKPNSRRYSVEDPLDYYKLTPDEIREDSMVVFDSELEGWEVDAVIESKSGKNALQKALITEDLMDAEGQYVIEDREQDIFEGLNSAIAKSHLKEDTTLFRGLPAEGAGALSGDIRPGQIIQSRGYLGTSFDLNVAENFKGEPNQLGVHGEPTTLVVKLPKGMMALDVDAAIALYNKNSVNHNWTERIQKAKTIDDLDIQELSSAEDDLGFYLGISEGEIILPRDLALKVLKVEERNGQKYITVTPDGTLNNLYGTNVLRDNVDVFFNKVTENNQMMNQIGAFEVGTPEHYSLVSEAFYNGLDLPAEMIEAYPDLRIAKELTQSIPESWLLQAVHKNTLANRIIGQFTKEISYTDFERVYGRSFVYAIGDGRYTRDPALAIRASGRAVLYDLGEGFDYHVPIDDLTREGSPLIRDILAWMPEAEKYVSSDEARGLFTQKVISEANTLKNKKGETFVDFIDRAYNLTKAKKVKKVPEYFKVSFDEGKIVHVLKNQPNKPKQLGELNFFKDMSAEDAAAVTPEMVYKALIEDEIHNVENLQEDFIKLQKQRNEAKTQLREAQAAAEKEVVTDISPVKTEELVTKVENTTKEIKQTKKKIEKAKKIRETKINNANKISEDYNQIIKGAVDFGTEGKYIIALFKNADVSTLVHESAHIFRRTVLDTEMLEHAENALGVKNGKWTREAEEAFATAFEKYLTEGKAPTPGLEGLFSRFKSWLTQIYMNLTKSPLEYEIAPELRKVFDEMFSEERVNMAERAGFKNEEISKGLYEQALTYHKNSLEMVNSSIKDIDSFLKQKFTQDSEAYETMRQQKIARIDSKLDMLDVPRELTTAEIQDKMAEMSKVIREADAEYQKVAEGQVQKNKSVTENPLEFYSQDMESAAIGFEAYTKTLGLSEEQIALLLNGEDIPEDLRLANLDKEAEANQILEGALKEFGDCSRGEF